MGGFHDRCMVTGVRLYDVTAILLRERGDGAYVPCSLPVEGVWDEHTVKVTRTHTVRSVYARFLGPTASRGPAFEHPCVPPTPNPTVGYLGWRAYPCDSNGEHAQLGSVGSCVPRRLWLRILGQVGPTARVREEPFQSLPTIHGLPWHDRRELQHVRR
jgi:hypothetical protein